MGDTDSQLDREILGSYLRLGYLKWGDMTLIMGGTIPRLGSWSKQGGTQLTTSIHGFWLWVQCDQPPNAPARRPSDCTLLDL